jgi:hypothetical protein
MAGGLIIAFVLLVFGINLLVLMGIWNRLAGIVKTLFPSTDLKICQKSELYYDSLEHEQKTRFQHSCLQDVIFGAVSVTALALTYVMLHSLWVWAHAH